MNGCETNLLSAYVDGELDAATHARIATHVEQCARCAEQVREIVALSATFSKFQPGPMLPIERTRLHQRIEQNVDAPLWRLGGMVGLVAASILVVAGTWLAVLPASTPQSPHRQGMTSVATATPEPWELAAESGFVPVPVVGDQVYLADAHLDEWMLYGLNGGLNGSQP